MDDLNLEEIQREAFAKSMSMLLEDDCKLRAVTIIFDDRHLLILPLRTMLVDAHLAVAMAASALADTEGVPKDELH